MSALRPFEPLQRTTVAEQVRDELRRRIVTGELQPGVRLPAERALAEQFAVARTSVREAIQALVAVGVIERRGNRSYVAEQLPGSALPAADRRKKALRELLEARRVLELTLFELAATRASARDRNETLDLARRVPPRHLDEFDLGDRQFHASIAKACANPVLVEVYGRVVEALAQADLSARTMLEAADSEVRDDLIQRASAEHVAIAEAYVAGDVLRMMAAVEAHLGPVAGGLDAAGRMARRQSPVGVGLGANRTVGM